MQATIFSTSEYDSRIAQIRTLMKDDGFDCLYVPYGPNQNYLTGLHAEATSQAQSRVLAALLPREGEITFVVPDRRCKFVEKRTHVKNIVTWSFPEDPAEVTVDALRGMNIHRGLLGVDPHASFEEVEGLQRMLSGFSFRSCRRIFEKARIIKSDEEIALLRETGNLADQALEDGLSSLREEATEAEVAAAIYKRIILGGGDIKQISVIAGRHPGFPEKTGNRKVGRNQLVLLFPKFNLKGYFSDITRIGVFGNASDEEMRIENALIESHEAAVATIKPGVPYEEIDRAGREALRKYDLAKYFTHGIGHGLGLETHEPPYLGTNTILEPGMVLTIEPSIYRPGEPAMRIEDTFIVTGTGCSRITNSPISIFVSELSP